MIRHWHLVEPDGSFHQTGTEDGKQPRNPRRLKVIEVEAHTNDPACHRYVDGRLVFDPEKRARLDRETEIITMPRLDFLALIERMVDEKITAAMNKRTL